MTHTLHRRGTAESLSGDYVFIMIQAVGFNEDGAVPKMQEFLRIALRHKPVNIGSVDLGGRIDKPEEVIANLQKIAHVVFDNKEAVIEFLKDLKKADLGLSVTLSGIYEKVDECLAKAGLKHHTANFSLGVWGKTEKLPSNDILEVTNMCGHALISANLVKAMVGDIKAKRKTPEEAAKALMPQCACGVFNPARAAKLMTAMVKK
jgi:hypothetical protein